MPNRFLVSVVDVEIKNRNGEVFAKGKSLLDSIFERDFFSGDFVPINKIMKMHFCDVKYYKTLHKPYPESLYMTGQIVSADLENNIDYFVFKIDNIYLHNGHREIQRIVDKSPSFHLYYNDKKRTLNK